MQITVFGASGKVGSLVVEEALRRGYRVVAFVHRHALFSPSNNLLIEHGDIYDAAAVSRALRGSDAVISCLGSWGTPKKNVLTAAMRAIIPAMREQKIRRIVTLTGQGANTPDQKAGLLHRALLRVPVAGAGKVFSDGEEHMRLLASSDLDWTTLRSPVMSNLGGSGYRLTPGVQSQLVTVTRRSVAHAILDQLGSAEFLRQAPVIYRK